MSSAFPSDQQQIRRMLWGPLSILSLILHLQSGASSLTFSHDQQRLFLPQAHSQVKLSMGLLKLHCNILSLVSDDFASPYQINERFRVSSFMKVRACKQEGLLEKACFWPSQPQLIRFQRWQVPIPKALVVARSN